MALKVPAAAAGAAAAGDSADGTRSGGTTPPPPPPPAQALRSSPSQTGYDAGHRGALQQQRKHPQPSASLPAAAPRQRSAPPPSPSLPANPASLGGGTGAGGPLGNPVCDALLGHVVQSILRRPHVATKLAQQVCCASMTLHIAMIPR